MNVRRSLTVLFSAAAVGLFAWSAVVWSRETKTIDKWATKRTETQAQIKTIRTDLARAGLQYQAFQKSISSVPDSLRRVTGKSMTEMGNQHQRDIRRLEVREINAGLDLTRIKRKQVEADAARKAATIPFAAAGVGATVCAILCAVLPRRRR